MINKTKWISTLPKTTEAPNQLDHDVWINTIPKKKKTYNSVKVYSLTAILFFGGWLSPFTIFSIFPDSWLMLDGFYIGIFWLLIKALFLVFVMMWFRWTFPRLRVDQLMHLCWKVFIPFALANLFFVAILELIFL